MLVRRADWAERLGTFLKSQCRKPFQYGTFDCCLFACDAVLSMTGTDLATDFRGHYHTRKEALRLIRDRYGKASVLTLADSRARDAGLPVFPGADAKPGDIVLLRRGKHDWSMGIGDLYFGIAVPIFKGITRVPLTLAVKTYRV
jgi:hypothetical protein